MAFDINQHLQQAGFGRGQQAGPEEVKVNESETPEVVVAGAEKAIWNAAKIAMALPGVGWLIEMLFPSNPGKAGLFGGLETEGLAGKQIRVGSGGPQGGMLAKIAGELMKNSAITDHTGGVGGDAGGGGSGDGGGGGTGGGESYVSI